MSGGRPHDGGDAQRRLDRAARWEVRLNRDRANEADFRAFAAWASHEANRAAADKIADVNAAVADNPTAFRRALEAAPVIDARQFGTRRTWLLGAATAAAAVTVGAIWAPWREAPHWETYATGRGETRTVRLEDGTVLRLNRGSSLRAAFSREARRVVLADAEVSFDVAHDPARPFLIEAGRQRIRVIGTEFNVLNYAGRTAITVRRGIVAVAAVNAPDLAPGVRLHAGQQFVHQPGAAAELVREVDPDAAFAWQAGRLIYDDADLMQVTSDLNRYFSRPVRLAGADVASLRFSGVLTVDSEDRVLDRLQAFLPLEITKAEREVVLTRRRTP